jgi:hypothetical protein
MLLLSEETNKMAHLDQDGAVQKKEPDLMDLQRRMRRIIMKHVSEHVAEDDIPAGSAQCPMCGRVYKFSKASPTEGLHWEREQHISGICSDACWPMK